MISGINEVVLVTTTISSPLGHGGEFLLLVTSGVMLGTWLSDFASGLNDRFSPEENDQNPAEGDDFFGEGVDLDDISGDELNPNKFEDLLGDVDDQGDENEYGDLGGEETNQVEVERRIDELENDVASLSSKMGAIRSENEEVIQTVHDIEDNVRKLLDVYEMVTQGVNPFIDEPENVLEEGGSFRLFDTAGDAESRLERDPHAAGDEQDHFFDDGSAMEGNASDDAGEDEGDIHELAGTHDRQILSDLTGSSADNGGDAKTFDDLKSEYRGGTHGKEGATGDGEFSGESASAMDVETREQEDANREGSNVDDDGEENPSDAVDPIPPTESRMEADPSFGGETEDGAREDKPYLDRLPSGYVAEMLVIEWLTYLRRHSSTSEALRALKYYETIDWIGGDAASSLQQYLTGLSTDDESAAADGGTQLTIDHHTTSLNYIGQLSGADVELNKLEWTAPRRSGGHPERRGDNGIQR